MRINKNVIILLILIILIFVYGCATTESTSQKVLNSTSTIEPLQTKDLSSTIQSSTSTPTKLLPTATFTIEPSPTVHGVQNPSGIIPAGMPVIIDDFVLVVDKSGMTIDGEFVGFEIQLKVIGEESRLFRYNAAALQLKDDLDNYYDFYYNISFSNKCKESDIYNPKQIQMEPNSEIIIEPHSSMMYASYFWWCLENHHTDIPGYKAIIPPNAKSLFLEFNGFGPFTDFSYEFKL